MAKHWTSGRVKTRLGAAIGDDAAARVHELFCVHLCGQLAGVSALRQVALDPVDKIHEVEKRLNSASVPRWQVVPQSAGDLGDRMHHWFEQLTSNATDDGSAVDVDQHAKAVLIGADCPLVSPHSMERAAAHLSRNDVVLGPALDGGYYLIGLRLESLDRSRNLFCNIPWSTEQVLSSTLRSAHRMGLTIGMLEPRHDVDTIDDLNRLRRTLRGSGRPEHVALDRKLNEIVGEPSDDDGRSELDADSIKFH